MAGRDNRPRTRPSDERMRAAVSRAILGAVLILIAGAPDPIGAQQTTGSAGCAVCHGELELLRQYVPTLARARELVVLAAEMHGSGHEAMACALCHTGFGTFPHSPEQTATATCSSCHEVAEADWAAGQHALPAAGGGIAASCATCHRIHGVETARALAEQPQARERMNARCTACHRGEALPRTDPHAGEVGCWSCHGPHAVRPVDHPEALIAPAMQAHTCGACHAMTEVDWADDAHGLAARRSFATGAAQGLPAARETPVCTACHGGHGMLPPDHEAFAAISVERCAGCHQGYADTYFGTYHGKATVLGSRIAASCAACHGSHRVFGQTDPRSTVHQDNLIRTCGECHPAARPAFVLYDSHPELGNWSRNPILTGSFWFMNGLLAFVFIVFGTHTLLWWLRLVIDRRRGGAHHSGPHDHE